jgi:capsular polysaccharide biosynthesis protein
VATYAIAKSVPPTYRSAAEIAVQVSGTDPESTSLGANNLAEQFAQEVGSSDVLSSANALLREPGGIPSTSITGSTVDAQNLISIQATAGSAPLAQRRAAAVAKAFVTVINKLVSDQSARYQTSSASALKSLSSQIAQAEVALGHAPAGSSRANLLQGTLDTLIASRASAEVSVANTAAAGRPSVTVINEPGAGNQIAPKPKLYAGVGLIVSLLIFGRVALLLARRRNPGSTAAI